MFHWLTAVFFILPKLILNAFLFALLWLRVLVLRQDKARILHGFDHSTTSELNSKDNKSSFASPLTSSSHDTSGLSHKENTPEPPKNYLLRILFGWLLFRKAQKDLIPSKVVEKPQSITSISDKPGVSKRFRSNSKRNSRNSISSLSSPSAAQGSSQDESKSIDGTSIKEEPSLLDPNKDSVVADPTKKRGRSPLAYVHKYPRVYAPPRPLVPLHVLRPLSIWKLLSLTSSFTLASLTEIDDKMNGDSNKSNETKMPLQKPPAHSRKMSSSTPPSVQKHARNPSVPTNNSTGSNPEPTKAPIMTLSAHLHAIHEKRMRPKTLILDLDETLIHSLSRSPSSTSSSVSSYIRNNGYMVEVKVDSGFTTLYTVLKRPYCTEFLDAVSQWYNLVIFTASIQEYADPMIDWLERDGKYFKKRFYRQHCTWTNTSSPADSKNPSSSSASSSSSNNKGSSSSGSGSMGYVKNLRLVEPDLSRVVIVDNSPTSYMETPANGIGIEGWINDPSDCSLLNLIPVLSSMRYTTDVRSILELQYGNQAFYKSSTKSV